MIRIEREGNGQNAAIAEVRFKNTPTYFFYKAIGLIYKKMYIYKIKTSTSKGAYIHPELVGYM